MKSIEIDFEVYKHLTMRRDSEETSYNDVIRDLLGLEKKESKKNQNGKPFVSKGVTFPHGTVFRATFKGERYEAKVKDGALIYKGERHSSPSSAAIAITGYSVNGWVFWECQLPNWDSWKNINELRNS